MACATCDYSKRQHNLPMGDPERPKLCCLNYSEEKITMGVRIPYTWRGA
jgi:hypothetical protein